MAIAGDGAKERFEEGMDLMLVFGIWGWCHVGMCDVGFLTNANYAGRQCSHDLQLPSQGLARDSGSVV